MVFNTKEDECAIAILNVLLKGKNKYTKIYSSLKFYFNTYQNAIDFLVEKKLVDREEIGYKNVDYSINDKGRKFLQVYLKMKGLI